MSSTVPPKYSSGEIATCSRLSLSPPPCLANTILQLCLSLIHCRLNPVTQFSFFLSISVSFREGRRINKSLLSHHFQKAFVPFSMLFLISFPSSEQWAEAEGTTVSPYPGQSQDNILITGTQWDTHSPSLFSLELWLKVLRERGGVGRGFQP